jgi:fucose 4-O-acetylase-like acetyltransferase
MSGTPQDRLIWLDVARGAGIVMVVVGHSFNDPLIRSPIFLFHMPLFFMLAGFTMKGEGIANMLTKRVPTLLVPYLCFFILVTLIDIGLGEIFPHPTSLNWNAPMNALQTAAYGGQMLKGSYAVFWFVTCLFLAQMAFGWLLLKLPRLVDWRWAAILAVCVALSYLSDRLSPSPWNVAIAPAAMIFLYAGQALRQYGAGVPLWLDLAIAAFAIASLFFADPLDMKYAKFGTPALSLIAALALSATFVRVMQLVARIPYLTDLLVWVGGASLTVMFLHMIMIFHFHATLGPLCAFLLALAVPLAIYPLIRANKTARRLLLGGR